LRIDFADCGIDWNHPLNSRAYRELIAMGLTIHRDRPLPVEPPEDKTKTFLADVFGEELIEASYDDLKHYFKSRGEVTDLRKLTGGFSSQAVVSLGDIVTKLDSNPADAERQRKFLSLDLGELNHYLPKALSEEINNIGGIALWDMTNVSKKYRKGNLFRLSKPERPLNKKSLKLIERLTNSRKYRGPTHLARMQGAQCLYDFVDHYLYVMALFHSEKNVQSFDDLVVEDPESQATNYRRRILEVRNGNVKVYNEIREIINPQTVNKLMKPLDYVIPRLADSADTVIHGDFKVENLVDGALIDSQLKKGKAIEDIARFLTDPTLNLTDDMVEHFIMRYTQHRSAHDPNHAYEKYRQLLTDLKYATHKENARRLGAMQKRNLNNPENSARMHTFLKMTEQSYRRLLSFHSS
jgi:hypothetical protein